MRKAILALLTTVFIGGVGTTQAVSVDLVADGGFALLAHGNAPDVDTSPWTTDEGWHEYAQREGAVVRSAPYALRYKSYWDPTHVWQNLGVQVAAGEDYTVDLWHAPTAYEVNEWYVPLSFDVSVWTSPDAGGPYTSVATRTVASTNTANVYQNFTDTFTAAELNGVVGHYMQLRLTKIAAGDHRLLIDDVAFFGPIPDEGSLVVSPAEGFAFTFADAATVVSNSLDLSYVAGGLGSNMVVSSITLIDETGPGFSVSPSSLTLTSPTPASEPVWVEFSNVTAGLAPNGVASATVQIIWNDASSSSSTTSSVPVSATYLAAHAGNILAAFNSSQVAWRRDGNGGGEADIAFLGIDTTVTGQEWDNNESGSSDTSYGTLLGSARTDGGAAQGSYENYNNNEIVITLTNNTGSTIELGSLNFDYGRKWGADTADFVKVSLDGDLGSAILTNVYGTVESGGSTVDLSDCDIDLTTLGDFSLANGEGIVLTFAFNLTGDIGILDNVAIIGSGSLPAVVGRVHSLPGAGWASLGISGLDTHASQPVDLIYTAGDLNTNVVITGVTFSNTVGTGFSAIGSFPVVLPLPDVTNRAVFELVFDNTVADLAPGEFVETLVTIEFNEPGNGPSVSEFWAYGVRPADVPADDIIALFDTEFLTPDAAYNGIKGRFTSAAYDSSDKGSLDNTYGTLATSRSAGTNETWTMRINGTWNEQVATLTVTNTTTASFDLTELRFDMGRWYPTGATDFTLGVSGDVSDSTDLLTSGTTELGWDGHDYDDHDLTLTNLTDHTLAAGESVTFTWTIHPQGNEYIGLFIDNITLMGAVDTFGGWSASEGLTDGVNDDPYDNPDNDGKDNMTEYATGGDPLVADPSNVETWVAEDGGTEWLYYVHSERQDDAGLAYTVGTKGNLLYDPSWDAGAVEEMGRADGPGLWKTVTNRTDIGSAAEFIGLTVEQN